MGSHLSKYTAHDNTVPELQSRKVSVASTQEPRSSSAEHLTAPLTLVTPALSETLITLDNVAPLLKPHPRRSNDSLRRHHADHMHDHSREPVHGGVAAAGLVGSAVLGVAVCAGDAFRGDNSGGGYDAGTDVGTGCGAGGDSGGCGGGCD